MKTDPKELGKAIAELRKFRKLTQRMVAEHTGLTVNYISLVENGERTVSFDALNRLAEVFGVPSPWIPFLASRVPASDKGSKAIAELHEATKETLWAAIAAGEEAKD